MRHRQEHQIEDVALTAIDAITTTSSRALGNLDILLVDAELAGDPHIDELSRRTRRELQHHYEQLQDVAQRWGVIVPLHDEARTVYKDGLRVAELLDAFTAPDVANPSERALEEPGMGSAQREMLESEIHRLDAKMTSSWESVIDRRWAKATHAANKALEAAGKSRLPDGKKNNSRGITTTDAGD